MIRPMDAADRPYVLDSWRRSIDRRSRSPLTRSEQDRQREQLVDTQRVLVSVDARGVIEGWCCYTALRAAPIVHYVYVRSSRHDGTPLRQAGIATALLAHAGHATKATQIVTTSSSTMARRILADHNVRVIAMQAGDVL